MKRFLIPVLLIVFGPRAFGQGTGLEMLNISPTPYSLSMAEATVSIPEGAASIYTNPALLALNESSTLDLGYSRWISDVNNIFGGANFLKGNRAAALSFYSSGSDDYEQRNEPGSSNGTFSIQYLSVSAAWAYDFKLFSLGAAAQYINEQNFTYRASGYAFNMGIARFFMDNRIRTGASVSNLGEMSELNTRATELPANFKAGISADIVRFTAQKNEELPILVSAAADFVYPFEDLNTDQDPDYYTSEPYFNLGLSLTFAETIMVNAGYKTQNNVRPVSFGAGIAVDEITFNYALIPFNTGYGTVHSIGLQYKF